MRPPAKGWLDDRQPGPAEVDLRANERHQTQLGYPIGTPPYLPPEAGGCPADERLDVYSLGVTLYELCTQVLPKVTGCRPIREVCPGSDAPDDLSRLLQAALAPDRWSSSPCCRPRTARRST